MEILNIDHSKETKITFDEYFDVSLDRFTNSVFKYKSDQVVKLKSGYGSPAYEYFIHQASDGIHSILRNKK